MGNVGVTYLPLILTAAGLVLVLVGLYLAIGLPWTLVAAGVALAATGLLMDFS